MGLFGGSKSTSTTQNYTDQNSAVFGDLSHDNTSINGDYNYNPVGLSDDNLKAVLDFAKGNYTTAVTSIQSSAEKPIDSSSEAYNKASSETANFFDSITPVMTIAAVALVGYGILRSR